MKISLDWLANYLPGESNAQAFADALTHGGLPVEVIEGVGSDTMIDVEVTSNRGDCLSHVGVARELSALMKREFKPLELTVSESSTPASNAIRVSIESPELCPHYMARVIKNVKIGPSPDWLVRRLETIGLRAINNVVDVTNYVMFEMGQPLHAFDYDKISGGAIVVRRASDGEKLVSIDGHERKLTADMLAICDANRPVALAGVMGGIDSEVSEKTVNVLLESARFDPLSIRKTARFLAMKSDSSYRFERGIDPTLPQRAAIRAAFLIQQLAGGDVLAGQVEAGASGYTPKKLPVRLARIKQILGVEIPVAACLEALARLGLDPQLGTHQIDCVVPSHRLDLNIEVDLVEEIARVVGYDKIPTKDSIEIRTTPLDLRRVSVDKIRDSLVAAGYFEAVTFSFVSDALSTDFQYAEANSLPRVDAAVRKSDANLRPSILPGLIEAVRHNEANSVAGAKLFEIGSAFWNNAAGELTEVRTLGVVGSEDYREIRGAVEAILSALDGKRSIDVVAADRAGFATGACGRIVWGGTPIGYIGKLSRATATKISLRTLPTIAEIEIEPLIVGTVHVPQLSPLPKYPGIQRDLSLIVEDKLPYAKIEAVVRSLQLADLEEVNYVTTYRGKPLEKGQKSVTIALAFRSPTGTLTSEQVELRVQQVIDSTKSQLKASLRA